MKVDLKEQDEKIFLLVDGRIDTQTASQLQEAVDSALKKNKKIVMDLDRVSYISSAGLRVMLYTQKKVNSSANEGAFFEVINVGSSIKEIFDMTGFSEFLSITEKSEEEESSFD